MTRRDVVIIGASVAGVSTAEGLRRQGFKGSITLVDSEPHLPYDKPPLSKQALTAKWDHQQLLLRPQQHYRDLDLELCLGISVDRLDAHHRVVGLADGSELRAEHVVIATGGRPLGFDDVPEGVFTLRGRDDARALRETLGRSRRLTVVGGGFVGAEVAATSRQEGLDVTIVEAAPLPFLGLLGRYTAEALAHYHRERGVRVRCASAVSTIVPSAAGPTVVLDDGQTLTSDVIVVGLGIAPNTEWLGDSDLALGDGVLCDERGATSIERVWAAGDVAAWLDPTTGHHRRGQHWTGARIQGTVVAHRISIAAHPHDRGTARPAPSVGVPYFWSDLYDLRLQCFGDPTDHDSSAVEWGRYADGQFVTSYYRKDELIAVVGVNAARELRPYRAALEQRVREASGQRTSHPPSTGRTTPLM